MKLAPGKDILAAVDKSLRAADKVNLIVKKWTSDPVALLFSIWQVIPNPTKQPPFFKDFRVETSPKSQIFRDEHLLQWKEPFPSCDKKKVS